MPRDHEAAPTAAADLGPPDIEKLRQSAEREVREELGAMPKVNKWVGHRKNVGPDGFEYTTFVAEISKEERDRWQLSPDEGEVADVAWFKVDELPDELHRGLSWLHGGDTQPQAERTAAGVPQVDLGAVRSTARAIEGAVQRAFEITAQQLNESGIPKAPLKPGPNLTRQDARVWWDFDADLLTEVDEQLRGAGLSSMSAYDFLPKDLQIPEDKRGRMQDFRVLIRVETDPSAPNGYMNAARSSDRGEGAGDVVVNLKSARIIESRRTGGRSVYESVEGTLAHEIRHLADALYFSRGQGRAWTRNLSSDVLRSKQGPGYTRRDRVDLNFLAAGPVQGTQQWWDRYLNQPTEASSWAGNVADSFGMIPRSGAAFQAKLEAYEVTVLEPDGAQKEVPLISLIRPKNRRRFYLMTIDALRQKYGVKRPSERNSIGWNKAWRESIAAVNRIPERHLRTIAQYGYELAASDHDREIYPTWEQWFSQPDEGRPALSLDNDYEFYTNVAKRLPTNSLGETIPASLIVRNVRRMLGAPEGSE